MARAKPDVEGTRAGAPRFKTGDRVRVLAMFPPGHVRTPWYIRGKQGVVERFCGAYPNPEELAYCRSGAHSAIAQSLLLRAGFEDVINVEGGWTAWTRAGLPTERPQPAAAD